jgi:hypothetical protein
VFQHSPPGKKKNGIESSNYNAGMKAKRELALAARTRAGK